MIYLAAPYVLVASWVRHCYRTDCDERSVLRRGLRFHGDYNVIRLTWSGLGPYETMIYLAAPYAPGVVVDAA